MSIQRCTQPLTSSLLKFALTTISTTSRSYGSRTSSICLRCQVQQMGRRKLSTVTEYRPHSLSSPPPPPRNANIPDTSIAGLSPEINNSRPPRQNGQYDAANSNQPEKQSISISENEAQKTKPVFQTPSTTPDSSGSKPTRPSRLRARKAAMSLTPTATTQLRNLLAQPEPKLIRVGVKNKGCSGLAYHLEYVDKPGMMDESVEQDGVKVLIESRALMSIIGSEMDWVEDKLNQRFVFKNPNISESTSSLPGFSGTLLTEKQRNNAVAENPSWSSLRTCQRHPCVSSDLATALARRSIMHQNSLYLRAHNMFSIAAQMLSCRF